VHLSTIIPVNREKHLEKADLLYKQFKDAGIRITLDDKKDSLGKRIHNAKSDNTPYVIVLGDKEIESGLLTIETRGEKIVGISNEDFIRRIQREIKEKILN
jgi:threonyl-tRNA synthetase